MKITLKDESLPSGRELHIKGLGTLVNGKAAEFSKEQVEAFEAARGMKIDKAFKNDPRIEVSGSGSKGGDD